MFKFLKEFLKDTGEWSEMRLVVFMLVCSGIIILFAGIPLDLIFDVNTVTGIRGGNLTPIITAGLTVLGLALGAKIGQKTQEVKNDISDTENALANKPTPPAQQ